MVNHKQSKSTMVNLSSKAEKPNAVNNIAVTSAKSNNSDYESVVATEYSNEHINTPRSIPQYAILKYGDDSQLIFNINCQVINFRCFSNHYMCKISHSIYSGSTCDRLFH